jgi:hypothetical protein
VAGSCEQCDEPSSSRATVLVSVSVEALRRADLPSRESNQESKNKIQKPQEEAAYVLQEL